VRPERLPAVYARKREIHQDKVRAPRLSFAYARRAVGGFDHVMASSLE
jgi:hypothetical protein